MFSQTRKSFRVERKENDSYSVDLAYFGSKFNLIQLYFQVHESQKIAAVNVSDKERIMFDLHKIVTSKKCKVATDRIVIKF